MMRLKTAFLLCLVLLALPSASCRDNPAGDERPVASVNGYVITERDLRRELSESVRFHDILGLTEQDKGDFLNGRIRKELLIQAAGKQGLDREESFRRTIEKFWEQTLITSLIERQCSLLENGIIVTRDEIEARYRKRFGSSPGAPPLKEVKAGIEKELREEKKTDALDGWIKQLWEDADITIHEEALKSIR